MTEPYERSIDRESQEKSEIENEIAEQSAAPIAVPVHDHNQSSPVLSGGDVDADWDDDSVGEESVGGGNPTPDQSVVEDLGRAMGLIYEDGEPLRTEEKLRKRDDDRWELDPASAEDFDK